MKRLLALLMAMLMVLSLAACATSSENTDDEKEESQKNEITDKNDQTTPGMLNFGNGTMTVTASGAYLDMLKQTMGLSFDSLEIVFDEDQAQASLIGKYNGKTLNESIYFGDNAFVVNSPNLLGGAYGVDLGTFDKDWKGSIFNPENGSEFAVSEEAIASFEQIMDMMESITNGDAASAIPGVDMDKYANAIVSLTETLMTELAKIYTVETKTEGEFAVSSVTITEDQVSQVLNVLADTLEKNKDIKEMVEAIIAYTAPEQAEADVYATIITSLRTFATQFDETFAEAQLKLTVTFKTTEDGLKNVFGMNVYVMAPDKTDGNIGFTVTSDLKNNDTEYSHKVALTFNVDGQFETMLNTPDVLEEDMRDGVLEDEESAFATLLPLLLQEGMSIETKCNKTKGDFTANVDFAGQKVAYEGALKIGETTYEFVFKKLTVGDLFDTSEFISNITFKFDTAAKKELSKPAFTNVLTMTEGNMVDFVGKMEGIFGTGEDEK